MHNPTLNRAIIASLAVASVATAEAAKRPLNFIYIMSDDHAANAIGAYGSRLASLNPTPNIDKLAKESIIFDNCFCSNSISSPSRATIITGQYSHNNGVINLGGDVGEQNEFLPIEMKKLGYQTAMVGKWHIGSEPSAFDYYSVFPPSGEQGQYFDPVFIDSDAPGSFPENYKHYKGHSSDIITDITLNWLENKCDKSKPFFIMHHYKAPHGGFEWAPRYDDYLENADIPVPSTMLDREGFGSVATRGENNELEKYIGSSISTRNVIRNYDGYDKKDYGSFEKNTIADYNSYIKRYLRCVKGVDDNLARLFDYLKQNDLWDNTVIIYTGDQGMFLGEHDFQDKRWMYEEAFRMPLIIKVPGCKQQSVHRDLLVGNVDFAPTILALAGAEKTPEYMDGKSFSSVFSSKADPKGWREAHYYRYWMHMRHHYNPSHFGIRTKDYKLIFFYGRNADLNPSNNEKANKELTPLQEVAAKSIDRRYMDRMGINIQTPIGFELYDMKNDPKETTNIADDPAYAEVLAKLKVQLLELKAEVGDTDNDTPEIQEIIKEYF